MATIPLVSSQVVDPKTGLMNRDWYLALLQVSENITGAVVSNVIVVGNNGITVTGSPITSAGIITLGIGNLTCNSAIIAGTITAANAVISGSVLAGANLSGASVQTLSVSTVNIFASGTVSSVNVNATGTISSLNVVAANISSVSTITASNVIITGSVTFANPQTSSLGGNVSVTNSGAFFTGPSVSVGAIGAFFVSGGLSYIGNVPGASVFVRLTDGTSVIDSRLLGTAANGVASVTLSGPITSPVGNLRVDLRDTTSTGLIVANSTGQGKDSTISAYRIS